MEKEVKSKSFTELHQKKEKISYFATKRGEKMGAFFQGKR